MKKLIFIGLIIILMTINIVYGSVTSINFQGQLKNSTGNLMSGNQNITLIIYDNFTNGNSLWQQNNTNVNVKIGVVSITLKNINFTFNDTYSLGIKVNANAEMTPRINFTSAPYAFRANISDSLDAEKDYEVRNFTAQNITASYYFGDGSGLTGISGADTRHTINTTVFYNESGQLGVNTTTFNLTEWNWAWYTVFTNYSNWNNPTAGADTRHEINTSELYNESTELGVNDTWLVSMIYSYSDFNDTSDTRHEINTSELYNESGELGINDTFLLDFVYDFSDLNCSADNGCPLVVYQSEMSTLNASGTLDDGDWCRWDDTNSEIDCDVTPFSDTNTDTRHEINTSELYNESDYLGVNDTWLIDMIYGYSDFNITALDKDSRHIINTSEMYNESTELGVNDTWLVSMIYSYSDFNDTATLQTDIDAVRTNISDNNASVKTYVDSQGFIANDTNADINQLNVSQNLSISSGTTIYKWYIDDGSLILRLM